MVVFTLGYSNEVLQILLKAKNKGVKFEASVIETTPSFAGRKTAQILAKNGIFVNYFSDSALRIAMKKADLVLLGCDLISRDGTIYAKTGSELASEMAEKHDIPVYFCMSCSKYMPTAADSLEKNKKLGNSNELWNVKNKNINILNYKYEKVNPKLITGTISEFGILKLPFFVSEARKAGF